MTKLEKLVAAFPEMADGVVESKIHGVLLFQETRHIPRRPMVYDPGICIVLQGHKIGYLGGRKFRYDASNYLVTSVTMPFESETFASLDKPLRGLFIGIDMGQLNDLLGRIDLPAEVGRRQTRALPLGVGPATMDEDMLDAVTRLVKCLRSDTEAQILGPGLLREILYRALCGSQSTVLHALARHSGSFSQVARALEIMQNDYAGKLDVEHLAGIARMSTSAFHRAFKEVTSESPMQYLKKIRLTKARELMVQENMRAYLAADQVGYVSSSQFNREFKRYFGQSPGEMVRELRSA